MKRRVLRKPVQNAVLATTLITGMIACMIDDFEMSGLPLMLTLLAIIATGTIILVKWGRNYE